MKTARISVSLFITLVMLNVPGTQASALDEPAFAPFDYVITVDAQQAPEAGAGISALPLGDLVPAPGDGPGRESHVCTYVHVSLENSGGGSANIYGWCDGDKITSCGVSGSGSCEAGQSTSGGPPLYCYLGKSGSGSASGTCTFYLRRTSTDGVAS